ncbi:MAG: hypothetical protein ABH821_04245 [archaeon]
MIGLGTSGGQTANETFNAYNEELQFQKEAANPYCPSGICDISEYDAVGTLCAEDCGCVDSAGDPGIPDDVCDTVNGESRINCPDCQ